VKPYSFTYFVFSWFFCRCQNVINKLLVSIFNSCIMFYTFFLHVLECVNQLAAYYVLLFWPSRCPAHCVADMCRANLSVELCHQSAAECIMKIIAEHIPEVRSQFCLLCVLSDIQWCCLAVFNLAFSVITLFACFVDFNITVLTEHLLLVCCELICWWQSSYSEYSNYVSIAVTIQKVLGQKADTEDFSCL